MTTDGTFGVVAVLVNYLVHSTLLLGAVWILDRRRWIVSQALRETLWKAAAVVPFLSTAISCLGGWSQPVLEIALDVRSRSATSPIRGETEEGSTVRPEATKRHARETPISTDIETEIPARTRIPADAEDVEVAGSAEFVNSDVESPYSGGRRRDAVESTDRLGAQALPDAESRRQPRANSDLPASATAGVSQFVGRAIDILLAGLLLLLPTGAALSVLRLACVARRISQGELLAAGPARATLDRICRDAGIRRSIRLRRGPRLQQPVACGLMRWTIVLPTATELRLSERQLEALLAHELAHLVRGDVAWLWFGQLLCTCLCWQPLNFVARRRWRSAAEFQCDDWAVDHGAEPLSLASCLAEVAGWRVAGGPSAVGLTATGTPSEFGRRIRRLAGEPLADHWQGTTRCWLLRAGVVIVAAALGCWAPRFVWSVAPAAKAAARDGHSSKSDESPVVKRDTFDDGGDRDVLADPETLAAWRQLNEELHELHDMIQRLPAPSEDRGDGRVAALIEQLRQRAARLEARRLRFVQHWGEDAPSVDAALDAASLTQP